MSNMDNYLGHVLFTQCSFYENHHFGGQNSQKINSYAY